VPQPTAPPRNHFNLPFPLGFLFVIFILKVIKVGKFKGLHTKLMFLQTTDCVRELGGAQQAVCRLSTIMGHQNN
jgi:hypothetical protein